jgi:hypothetical protein
VTSVQTSSPPAHQNCSNEASLVIVIVTFSHALSSQQ